MDPLIICGIVVAALLFLSNHESLSLTKSFPRGAPGAGPILQNQPQQPVPSSQNPPPQQSPNATLQTINQGIVVANGALGLLDKISTWYTDSSSSDSEYPVGAQVESPVPIETSPIMTSLNTVDYTDAIPGDSVFNSSYV